MRKFYFAGICMLSFHLISLAQVGINTNNPSHPLHINGNTRLDGRLGINTPIIGSMSNLLGNGLIEARSSSADSSAFILALCDGSDGYPAINFAHARGSFTSPISLQNHDVLWSINGIGYQGSDFTYNGGLRMEVEATNPIGIDNLPTNLIFSTTPESTIFAIDRMVLDANGNLGINQLSPKEKLHINGSLVIEEGRIRMLNNGNSIFLGDGAGLNDDLTFNNNVYIGNEAGKVTSNAENNVAIGYSALNGNNSSYNFALGAHALEGVDVGNDNIGIGNFAGYDINGQNNIYIGSGAGESVVGTNNVIIGRELGTGQTIDNTLMIDNQNTESPLITGRFDLDEVTINGQLHTTDNLGVNIGQPLSTLDVNGTVGMKTLSNLIIGVDDVTNAASIYIFTDHLGSGSITLPPAINNVNRMYVIINKSGMSADISSYIDMSNTIQTSIAAATSVWLISDGTSWQQMK